MYVMLKLGVWYPIMVISLLLVVGCGDGADPPRTPTTSPSPTSALPPTATSTPNIDVEADIANFAHVDLDISAGTTVIWTNKDGANHTTSSLEGIWDSGELGSANTFSFTFTDPGTYPYRCNIHTSMTASVTVTG